MRPCVTPPLLIRGAEFGGQKPLFCVPLVARHLDQLLTQAQVAHGLGPDVVEWRVDSYGRLSDESVLAAAQALREVLNREPIVFTLRSSAEGGTTPMSQDLRAHCIDTVLRSGLIDLVDVELCNGPQFLEPIIETAHAHAVRVILSFHDFQATPSNETLLGRISAMIQQGADIAKVACMPREPGDVLRLLQVTLTSRQMFPAVPLCTMSMGSMGSLSRVAGFLYGSDMAFAVGQETSAPGQIPLMEARAMTEALLHYA
jgi:3-dehydroquinate dehydratase I